jgi:hypothetical protein
MKLEGESWKSNRALKLSNASHELCIGFLSFLIAFVGAGTVNRATATTFRIGIPGERLIIAVVSTSSLKARMSDSHRRHSRTLPF